MKTNELMVGDWVHLHYKHIITGEDVHSDFQVGEIREEDIWAIPTENHRGNMGDCRFIEPIPLTREILEKNGFDCSDKEIARFYFEDGDYKEHFTLRAMYEKETGTQKGWGFFAFNVLVVLDYVHELQHALKICGIEKEILL